MLLDNGRSAMLGSEFQDMLRCIRCGACMNHCPIYNAVGGHAYGWVYPGPMGSVLTPALVGGVGLLGMFNWLLLFGNHTTVAATRDLPLWRLFPPGADVLFLIVTGCAAATYVLRDHASHGRFTFRQRAVHLALTLAAFTVVPTIASFVLRVTGEPYTYIHDGALMIEWAARKLLAGQNPYVANYLDTPLYYWPMINNPALYHLTYFPFLYLVTAPFVFVFDHLGIFWDERFLYLPAYIATLLVVPLLARRDDHRLAIAALVGLNPQLFPFVVEGRNDFFVLFFLFLGLVLLQRDRRALGSLAIAASAAAKLHAALIIPFVIVYLVGSRRPRSWSDVRDALWPTLVPATAFLALMFVPMLLNDFGAFWDDIVSYNAGGAAWSYPISGMGFSALLLRLGVIRYAQAGFPFAAIELAVATPVAAWWLWKLWRAPTLPTLLGGYALTLLAFLFFGRYFQGNYLGFVAAVATPMPFLLREAVSVPSRVRPRKRTLPAAPKAAPPLPVSIPIETPVAQPEAASAGVD